MPTPPSVDRHLGLEPSVIRDGDAEDAAASDGSLHSFLRGWHRAIVVADLAISWDMRPSARSSLFCSLHWQKSQDRGLQRRGAGIFSGPNKTKLSLV